MSASGPGRATDSSPFDAALLYAAAKMYYDEEATQAEVAGKLRTSRATVSRLLSEARRQGIVQITVHPPRQTASDDLEGRLARHLGLTKVFLSSPLPAAAGGRSSQDMIGSVLAPAVSRALTEARLSAGDVVLVSSGWTMYEVSRFELPLLPGVVVAPTVGGTDQPESWFQTNEIVRRFSERVGARPTYLYAPALPGPELYQTLLLDPAIERVLGLWPTATVVLAGIGAPPLLRTAAPQFVVKDSPALREAVGDICSRFYDRSGAPVTFEGSERIIAVPLETLKVLPAVIAVAAGPEKIDPIVAGARAGYFSQLVTDPSTAHGILAAG